MTDDFVMSARAVEKSSFVAEPGPTLFLQVPSNELPSPKHAVARKDVWVKRLRKESIWGKDVRTKADRCDILIFIHGSNNSQHIVMQRHRQLKADLAAAGWKGCVVSFEWPSDDMTLNYLEDRHDAKQTALQLVTDGTALLSQEQGPDCTINVHLLDHSTGAYVIREAFDDADDASRANNSWLVSQIALIGGDVSAGSLSADSSSSESLYPPLHQTHELFQSPRLRPETLKYQASRHGPACRPRRPTANGSLTSPISGPPKAGSTSRRWWLSSPDGSSAGRCMRR